MDKSRVLLHRKEIVVIFPLFHSPSGRIKFPAEHEWEKEEEERRMERVGDNNSSAFPFGRLAEPWRKFF